MRWRPSKSELFLLAVSHLCGEGGFYEQANDRDDRYVSLIHAVAVQDAEWLHRFLVWLRTKGNLRTATDVRCPSPSSAGSPTPYAAGFPATIAS